MLDLVLTQERNQLVLVGQGSVETSRSEHCAPSAGPRGPMRPSFPPLEQLEKQRWKKDQIIGHTGSNKRYNIRLIHYPEGQHMGHGDPLS